MAKQAYDYGGLVLASSFCAPVIGGAIIYYTLQGSHKNIAKLGNRFSFLSIPIWFIILIAFSAVGLLDFVTPIFEVVGIIGIILSIYTVVQIKKTPKDSW